MKYLTYISSLLLLLLCSCSDDIQSDTPNAHVPDGTPIEIMAAAEFPEMNFGADSRAFVDQPTADYLQNTLKVNILVFDAAGVMLQFIPPTDIAIERIDTETSTVYFKVKNIYASEQPRRLHFVVTSAPDIREIEGGDYITAMANETTVMPALMASGDTDVYWGLSEPEKITDGMTLQMRVIRNFVKVIVKNSTSNFKLLGYTVVNRPSKGTVVPFIHQNHTFASFLNDDKTLKSYDDILAQGYYGINPAGSEAGMTHTKAADVEASLAASEALLTANPSQDSPYYFYERSQSGIASVGSDAVVTYLIVKGEYGGNTYYYKLDIGGNRNGKFEFYDLLRNFQYTFNITNVSGPGAKTLQEAMNGATYNNISASVVTHDLFAISYYNEQIVVSDTRVIFTEKTTDFQLRFRYTVPTGLDYEFAPADLKVYDLNGNGQEYNMEKLPKDIDLGGEVVESARLEKATGVWDGWYILNITTKDIPTDARRWEQELRIYYGGGTVNLGRSVTLMLRQPWLLTDVKSTTPNSAMKNEFSVNFTLPSGLVSAQFPLTLTFESDKQNIYAKQGTNLSVAVDKSGFTGATTDNIILYEWSIPWTDYHGHNTDGSDGGAYTANFLTNTTAAEDQAYSTAGIDKQTNGTRETNNSYAKFCIRIANKGMKVIEPHYVNITRTN